MSLTTEEALQHKLGDFRAQNIEELLERLNLKGAEIRHASETWAETLVRFLTHPVVSSLLMTAGILGIIIELRSPGFGIPGILGIAFLALFFWGHRLVQLAGWEELLLVGIGQFLLALEISLFPVSASPAYWASARFSADSV